MTPFPKTNIKSIFSSVLSAVFLILSFPDFNFYFFAWLALVPLLYALDNKKPAAAFIISYMAGLVFFTGTLYWLIHVTLPGMILVILYTSLYFGMFGLCLSLASGYSPIIILFLTPPYGLPLNSYVQIF